ncbi:MAG: hypothetical protein NW201_14635 [Gemmatimonadales bacterium]|nr:hypothetical protein [Gemmatimonadales bacterium]
MPTTTLKLVTIIAEPVLEATITHDLERLGASGWSITEGRGKGSRGLRASDIPGSNIRIETIVSEPVAEAILRHAAEAYFPNYSVIAYLETVQVARGDKYV